jgi:MFS family permease
LESRRLNPWLAVRLSVMMFLQFFIWGSWYVTVGNYMAAIGLSDMIFWAYTVGPLAALVSPFLLGRVADRYFAAEYVLGVLNLVGGLAIGAASIVGGASGVLFVALLLLHTLCFFPTIGLTSTLTFHHINHPEKQFPLIRVFGSLGWILAGVLVSAVLNADETVLPVRIAAIASLAMGLYCFTLPHTPPRAEKGGRSVRDILGLDALKELRTRPFIVFVACELLISIPLSTRFDR